jgi:long-chain fatty acid transport protein
VNRPLVASMLALVVTTGRVHAAGFMLFEQSGRGLGSAFAGEVAEAVDASTIQYNPAGLGWIEGTQFASSGFAVLPAAHFSNDGSSLNPALGGGPLRGGDGSDAGALGLFPVLFLAHELGDGFHVGLGVTVPFGLETRYDHGWVGRYHAINSKLETTNVNPTIAWRPVDWFAIGFGADIEYAKARLTNAIDLGGVCEIFGAQSGIPPGACTALGFAPQSTDATVKISGDDWGAGWNMGLMLQPWTTTRIGLSFRSDIVHNLAGRATLFVPKKAAPLRKISGALFDTDASASADLPERATIGVYHELTPTVALLADATWTRWSRFDELVFKFANPKQPTIVQPEGWQDTFRYALGMRWRPTPTVETRLGFAWDESAIPNETLRTPRIPDSDRFWLSAGVGWQAFERLRVDVGYAHLFSPDVNIRNADPVTGHILHGSYSLEANLVGVQMTYNIGWPPL